MPDKLLIVESPAKAKTIEKYLGGAFKVKSSFGHVRDLDKGKKGVDVDHGFKPKYVVTPEKKKVVKDLKDWVKKVDEVWLATDEDREGEAISWHLCEVLGLDPATTKRIVFREITKPAIQKAIQSPRTVDLNLVNAQQARRILDRLVGFDLSEILWRKIRNNLSAGRVQSVAVKLVVEKEREIQGFESQPFFKVSAFFTVKKANGEDVLLKAELPERLNDEKEAREFLEKCVGASFDISDIEVKPLKRKPAPPFTTSTLQQEASRKLGFSVSRTMSNAQKLYESGYITYMRTDSISLSELAIKQIAEQVEKEFGSEYSQVRRYKSKRADAQEAHEAIRPTYFDKKVLGDTRDQQRLYELIYKRTMASQMAEARLEKTIVSIEISTQPDRQLRAEGEVLKFDGFLKMYMESTDDEEEDEVKGMLPPLSVGQALELNNMEVSQRFTRPPARFTEASLVKRLEELGIGRPSTYAPTISKIMEEARGYVKKESRPGTERSYKVLKLDNNKISEEVKSEITGATSNRLYPTDMGMIVTDFLDKHFPEIMDYSFTADIEKKFDEIADGHMIWNKMIDSFYDEFKDTVVETMEQAGRERGRRELGTDPESGHTVLVQMTRFGPVVQIGTKEEMGEDEKPRFANLQLGQSIETITYDEAMELFKLPREIGSWEGKEMMVNNGRYGPYVKWGDMFVSLPRGADPMEIGFDECVELVKAKLKENAPIYEYKGKPVTKGKGRFGPYIKWNDMFINIPKKHDPDDLSTDIIEELIEAKITKEANRYIKRWEDDKIAIENGRWGPFIRFGKKSVKLPKTDGKYPPVEELKAMDIEDVKKLIEAEIPNAFKKKTTKKAAKSTSKTKAKKK